MTENHNYNTPSEGATEWHIPLNDNFQRLDAEIEIRDTESSLGDYKPKSGAKFLATDTENVFMGDGTEWWKLESSGKNPSLESVTTKRLSGDITGENGEITHLGANVYVQGSEPDNPSKNDIWIDTS